MLNWVGIWSERLARYALIQPGSNLIENAKNYWPTGQRNLAMTEYNTLFNKLSGYGDLDASL